MKFERWQLKIFIRLLCKTWESLLPEEAKIEILLTYQNSVLWSLKYECWKIIRFGLGLFIGRWLVENFAVGFSIGFSICREALRSLISFEEFLLQLLIFWNKCRKIKSKTGQF